MPASLGLSLPAVVEVAAHVIARPLPEGDVAAFLGAVRDEQPSSFSDLLDESLSLGS